MRYIEQGIALVVLAGKEYGSGSSRDWAAKGTKLLGVRAVIAESYERIHRSNLVGMGVLPLQFPAGESAASLGLTGEELISISGLADAMAAGGGPPGEVAVRRRAPRWRAARVFRQSADRHAPGGGLLPPRRHPAIRPEGASGAMSPAAKKTRRTKAVPTPALLLEMLKARGPSGYETAPAAVWRAGAKEFAEVSTDLVGTPLALVAPRKGGKGQARRLVVMGHIDEIGLIVTHIDDDGFLWFGEVGGWDPQILVGQRIILDTRKGPVKGIVGRKPIHLLRAEERKKVPEIRDLHIDIGARDGSEARSLVRIGDVAVIDSEPVELPNGRLVSRALDNRLGSFIALEAARLVAAAGGAAGWELAAVAAAQEETTFGGSRTSAFSLAPDAAIVVDVTHATDAPGVEVREAGKHELGSGAVIGRGSVLNPALFELLHDSAEAEKIPFTIEADGRGTGTDADAVHLSRGGVPTGLVSIPLRYMHSPVELVELADVMACAELIAAFALRLTAKTSFAR